MNVRFEEFNAKDFVVSIATELTKGDLKDIIGICERRLLVLEKQENKDTKQTKAKLKTVVGYFYSQGCDLFANRENTGMERMIRHLLVIELFDYYKLSDDEMKVIFNCDSASQIRAWRNVNFGFYSVARQQTAEKEYLKIMSKFKSNNSL
jgi:hypothetical protein